MPLEGIYLGGFSPSETIDRLVQQKNKHLRSVTSKSQSSGDAPKKVPCKNCFGGEYLISLCFSKFRKNMFNHV